MKLLITREGKSYVFKGNDLHTQYGFIGAAAIEKAKPGEELKTNTGKKMTVLEASFADLYQRIKRNAQIIPLKDIGAIITETGMGSKSRVLDAGAGSGGLACFLAHIAREVVCYEIRDDFYNVAMHNKEMLGLSNLKLKKGDIYAGVRERNVDVMTLDVPEPWKAIATAEKALKSGGFAVSYSPSVPQMMDFVSAVKKSGCLMYVRSIEVFEREWEIDARRVRPKSQRIGHSGFLSFARKIGQG